MSELSLALSALASLGIVLLIISAIMAARLAGRRPGPALARGSVTILKPLHGAEPGLLDNLMSFARQEYGAPVQMVLGVQRSDDPALEIVQALREACPLLDVAVVVDARLYGTNRKVSNLINMAEAIRHDIVVLADSDMMVGPDYLARLVDELARPGIGAVTCPYHGLPQAGLWPKLATLAIDTHFLPGVAMGAGIGVGHPTMGSTIALTRVTLERIGGFRSLADELADDHALGARVRSLGLEIAVTGFTIGHVCAERSFGELLHQELRWQRTIRQVTPSGHAGSVLLHPVALALAAFLLAPGVTPLATLGAAVAARISLCIAVERLFGLKVHPYWLVPARDLLSFALFVASFFGRGVSWRGHHYDVARGGALIPKTRPDIP